MIHGAYRGNHSCDKKTPASHRNGVQKKSQIRVYKSIYRAARFLVVFFGLSSLGGAGVFSIFLTASSNVVGGRMIGLPWRPVGLGVLDRIGL